MDVCFSYFEKIVPKKQTSEGKYEIQREGIEAGGLSWKTRLNLCGWEARKEEAEFASAFKLWVHSMETFSILKQYSVPRGKHQPWGDF